ncbi:TetR/AcrR family transcriptional regulator [soil metagenome]
MTDLADPETAVAEVAAEKRPLRREAERNRQLIMDAARVVFAERGLDVTLDDIAKHAGVGVGTAYRRFANKDALIDELFEDKITEMVTFAEEALQVEDPWLSITGFFEKMLEVQAADRGLKQVLVGASRGRERVCDARDRITPLTKQIVERAIEAGAVRPDFEESDMPMISVMVGSVMDATRDVDPDAWRRYLQVVLAGIAAHPETCGPLPQPAMTRGQVETALHREHSPG